MDIYTVLMYGFIGGIAPEIIRVHKILKEDGEFSYSHKLILLSLLVALLGSAMALALQASTAQQAIWIGASTPVIISQFAKTSPR